MTISEVSDFCVVCAPDGPSTPFGSPLLVVFDTLRMACWILAGICAVYTPRAILAAKLPGQRARFLGQTLFATIAVATEVDHFGDIANYRLFVNVAALALCTWGLLAFFREKRNAPQSR